MSRVVGIIPARLESERFPRKALHQIAGHPMIVWVYRRARQAPSLGRLLVATDSDEIASCCRAYQIPVALTSSTHRSGTERVLEVMAREVEAGEKAVVYVNIQGDEPMVTARHIELLLRPFREAPVTQVSTLKVALAPEEAMNPNNVKVVTDLQGRALYFSRSVIPHACEASGDIKYFKHLGLYAYAPGALAKFRELAPSPLEQAEKLEQLRFLANGIPVIVVETAEDTIGVDTVGDLQKVEEHFRRVGAQLPGPLSNAPTAPRAAGRREGT